MKPRGGVGVLHVLGCQPGVHRSGRGQLPFSFALPAQPTPRLIDQASSAAASVRIRDAATAGEPIPEGAATTDAGIRGCVRCPVGGCRARKFVTALSQAARTMLGCEEMTWDDLCTSAGCRGRAGTGGNGSWLTGGQVVAGSNPVSPTLFVHVRCYLYLLPRWGARALDSVSKTPWNRSTCAAPNPRRKCRRDLRVCPESDACMAETNYRRVVTRKSADGGSESLHVPNLAVELGLSSRRAAHSVMPAARVIVTEVSQLAPDSPRPR